jgi:tetratricopeptide (TPR) repeat protein
MLPVVLGPDNRMRVELAPGVHKVQVSWPDGEMHEEQVKLDPGSSRTMEIARKPRPFNLSEPDGIELRTEGRPETLASHGEGMAAMTSGDWAQARQIFDRVVGDEPGFWPAVWQRGEAELRLGDYQAARVDLEAAHRTEPRSGLAQMSLGDAYLETGDLVSARASYQAALQIHPQLAQARAGLGLADYYEGQSAQALVNCKDALGLDESCIRAHLVLAAAYEETDRYAEAVAACSEALRRDPGALLACAIRSEASTHLDRGADARADAERLANLVPLTAIEVNYMARIRSRLGNNELALGDLDRALGARPGVPWLLTERARISVTRGDFDAALRDASEAIQRLPGNWNALTTLGLIHIKRSDFEKAIEELKLAREVRPKHGDTTQLLAYAHFRRGNFDDAVQLHEEAIELDSSLRDRPVHLASVPLASQDLRLAELARAYVSRGRACQAASQTSKALWAYGEAVRTAPGIPDGYRGRAEFHRSRKNFTEARTDLAAALQLAPGDAATWYELGLTWQAMGNSREAIQAYSKAILQKPDFAPAWQKRGALNYSQRMSMFCVRDMTKAIELGLEDSAQLVQALNLRGLSYLAVRRNQEAMSDFQEAVKLKPDDTNLYANLGLSLLAAEQYGPANKAFTTAIGLDKKNALAFNKRGVAILNESSKNTRKALADFETALALDPSVAEHHYNVAAACFNLHIFKRAKREFNEAISLDPTNSKYRQTYNNIKW